MKHPEHICRFNDGKSSCQCYDEGFEVGAKKAIGFIGRIWSVILIAISIIIIISNELSALTTICTHYLGSKIE